MALQVWLPLNGNFDNYGLSNYILHTLPSGASWSAGKLGNNLNISNAGTTAIINQISGLSTFSISFWYKFATGQTFTTYSDLINISMTSANKGNFRIEVSNNNGTTTNWYGHNLTDGGMGLYTTTQGVWYHDVIVVDGTNLKRYVNGVLVSEKTVNIAYTTSSLRLGDTGMYCQLADVRVYDHALSKREVKELSKGLVCHYQLKSNYGGQDNLFKASVVIGQSNCTVDKSQASGYLIKLPTTSGLSIFNSKDLITNGVFSSSDYGKTFTVSFTAWADANTNLASDLNPDTYGGSLGMPNDTAVINVFTTPTRLIYTGTITNSSGAMVNNTIFRFWHYGSDKGYNNTNIYITNIKVEVGNKVTPWCPNASDDNYMSSNIEYDTSGYCNHGTKSGTITYNSDTPRYSVSTNFTGDSSTFITIPAMILDMTNITFSVWAKWSSFNTWSRVFDFGEKTSGSGYAFLVANNASSALTVAGRLSGGASLPDTTIQNISLNTWYHIVVTLSGIECKTYLNGILVKTFNLNGLMSTATPFNLNYLGKSNWSADKFFAGNISDFRIYATALSADDVKELYNQPISFNKHSTMIQGEFIEK